MTGAILGLSPYAFMMCTGATLPYPWLLHICSFGPWASFHHSQIMLLVACEATVADCQSGLQQRHLVCHFGIIPPNRTPSFV